MSMTKLQYIYDFCKDYDYSEEAVETFADVYEKTKDNAALTALLDDFYKDESVDVNRIKTDLDRISKDAGVHIYTLTLLFFICLSEQLKKEYAARGIDEDIYKNSMSDLCYKTDECHKVYGVWGTFVPEWLYLFFRLRLYGIGRLEYELFSFPWDDVEVGGIHIKKGQKVINCHIPEGGGSFDKESRMASYRKAEEFFAAHYAQYFAEGKVFICHSWLLFPANREMGLPAKSNVLSFMDDFRIIGFDENEGEVDMWRIFGKEYQGDPENLPQNTSMQKAYANWLKAGKKVGCGHGVFVYDHDKENDRVICRH